MLDLEPIKAREEARTPGEWFIEGDGIMNETRSLTMVILPSLAEPEDAANAEFIVNAPSDVAALIAEVEMLRIVVADQAITIYSLTPSPVYPLGFLARTGNLPEDVCLTCGRPGSEHGGRLFSCPPDALRAARASALSPSTKPAET